MRLSSIAICTATFLAGASVMPAQGSTSIIKPISFGISGGVAVPTGGLSDGTANGTTGVNTGYDATASLAVALPALPFGLRGDASYAGFGGKSALISPNPGANRSNADVRIASFTANVVYQISLPLPVVRPYLIGGVGAYNVHVSPSSGGSSSSTNTGFNIGAGVALPLILANTFIEARYHYVSQSNGTISYVPITVGIMF